LRPSLQSLLLLRRHTADPSVRAVLDAVIDPAKTTNDRLELPTVSSITDREQLCHV
jgi:hypothetical protein